MARWSSAHCGEESCAVRIEEVLSDDCHCAIDCFTNLDESSVDRFVNTMVRTGHVGCRHTNRNHRLLDSGYSDISHGRRQIYFGCHCGSGRHRGGNRRHGVDDTMTVVACHPYDGRIVARPTCQIRVCNGRIHTVPLDNPRLGYFCN